MNLEGTRLGKYELHAEIGRGGMGMVYRGYDPALTRPVAVKVLAPHLVWDENFVRRFMHEAQAAARLKHPNIVTIYDVGEQSGWYYFVMEYLEGHSLSQVLRERGRLPGDEALSILGQLADALDYAHAQGLVHRDVKPGNVIVDQRGHITLTDFGLVRAAQGAKLTATGTALGTPQYMSPEQATGKQVGPPTDLYSLAIIAYELLAGVPPFDADSTPAVLYMQVHEPPPPIVARCADLPPLVDEVLKRALAKDPAMRYESGRAFVAALAQALQGLPAPEFTAPPVEAPVRERREVPAKGLRVEEKTRLILPRRRKVPVWVWALAGGLLLVISSLVYYSNYQARQRAIATEQMEATVAAQAQATAVVARATNTPRPTPTSAQRAAGMPVKVAILVPLSGDMATFGESARNGAMMAIEEWNARGGILGRQIRVFVEDSQCNAAAAASAANKVIDQDGVKSIIGEVCSSASIAVSEIAAARNVVQISPSSTNPQVTIDQNGNARPTVFRACFIDPFQGMVGAKFALDQLGAKTAAVFLDPGNDYVRGLAEFFRGTFEAGGGKVVVWETYTAGERDFSAILAKVRRANPDVLYLPDYYSTVNVIAAQAREKGITAVMMGGDGWDSPQLDRAAVDGGYFTNHYSAADPRPIVQEWVRKYQARYGAVPDALATLAYDAANILFKAIEQAGTDDPAQVAQRVARGQFEVVSGRVTFDEHHNPMKPAFVLHVVGGRIEFVTVW